MVWMRTVSLVRSVRALSPGVTAMKLLKNKMGRTACASFATETAAFKEKPEPINGLEDPDSESVGSKEEADGNFSNFRISSKTVKKLVARDINYLFPIQSATYDAIYDGHDVVAQARTGTGKTAQEQNEYAKLLNAIYCKLSFVLPICEKLREAEDSAPQRPPKVICLAPTRELALQIGKEFELVKSKRLSMHCFYGGTPYDAQTSALRRGLDILVGTPGRILDHLNKTTLDLSKVRHITLDEADRMLDMGFQDSIESILSACYGQDQRPQTLLFSATMPDWVRKTADKYMKKDRKVIDLIGKDKNRAACSVEHKAICCPYTERAALLGDIVQVYSGAHGRCIIFTSTKKEANELSMNTHMKQDTQVLHGDISQSQREITLQGFRDGRFRCLVATDVASRGLDIPEVDLVIQTEPPKDVDDYIHRSGRTGRAGRAGVCIVFYKKNQEEALKMVERRAGIQFKRVGAPQPSDIIEASVKDAAKSIEVVNKDMLPLFRPAAEQLVERLGATDALAAALAIVSGNTQMKTRSLLSSYEGFMTMMITQNWELRGTGLIWKMLREDQPPEMVESIRGLALCKGKKAAVFDVPAESAEKFQANWSNRKFAVLEIPTVLPELEERPKAANHNAGNNRYGGFQNSYSQQDSRSRRFNDSNQYGNSNWDSRKRRGDFGGGPAKRFKANGYGH